MKVFDFDDSQLEGKLKEVGKKVTFLSLMRLILFFALGVFLVLGVSEHPVWLVLFVSSVAGFVALITNYNWHKDQEAIYLALENIKENASNRRARKLQTLANGEEFIDKKHPFSSDLDLFGDHSLFQLVNHTVSKEGKKSLADRIQSSFNLTISAKYREASKELASRPVLLKAMESVGLAFFKEEKSMPKWTEWLHRDESANWIVKTASFIGPLGGLSLSVVVYLGILPASLLGVWILLGMIFLGMVFKPLKEAGECIPSRNQLKTYRYWLSILEKEHFKSELLQDSQKPFLKDNSTSSQLLDQLDSLGLWIQNRINLLYIPLNLLFWTDLFLYQRLINWKSNHRIAVASFPSELVNWEVLISLGAFEFEVGANGKVISVENGLQTTDVLHPLLDPNIAIANDFALMNSQHVILLTGANMSGKTTFMRTLGINCVMVNMGLAPFAKEFGFADFQLYTSMRNSDNLGESVSSFYAELSRIKRLIERIESGEKIFFLLDEILKGTNTEDRIAGSEALIRQIAASKAQGIISTHDIELADLEPRMRGVNNFSFHSEIHDQNIDFDYKIKPGACPSFNAHKLMELMGIRFQEGK
jgi:hypothetical protein